MKWHTEFDLTDYNSYRVRAIAARACRPESDEELAEAFADKSRRKVVLGGGCNVILSNARYDDIDFVLFNGNFASCMVQGGIITAQAGVSLKTLSELAYAHDLSGLELFYDVPGTAGGAVFMNAETLGESFSDCVENVTWLNTTDMSFKTPPREALDFTYRHSFFQHHPEAVIAAVRLVLQNGDKAAIYKKMMDNQARRRARQPWDFPSAGSVFKRPPGRFVGQMVDELKLKGATCGGAMISTKHGGFIINHTGNATGQDILNLVALIQEKVFAAYQIHLELEQRII